MACPLAQQGKEDKRKGQGEEEQREEVTYDNYLQVPALLSCQKTKSKEHTELLFILVHQAFELWFKQILADIDAVRATLQEAEKRPEKNLLPVVTKLQRIVMVFKLVIQQFAILETMTPMEFMNFRGLLSPASGFQSLQFRLIEIKLGINKTKRIPYNKEPFTSLLEDEAKRQVAAAKQEPSLLDLLGRWLETTPGVRDDKFRFVDQLRDHVTRWKADCGEDYDQSGFENILDEAKYKQAQERGDRRLSHQAFLGALMTMLYREEPVFSHRYTVLSLLMDIETALWQWRSGHVMMVHRMIGVKPGLAHKAEANPIAGPGGCPMAGQSGQQQVSGVSYLRATVAGERYRVFVDLFNIASYLLPARFIPPLPSALSRRLTFAEDQSEADEE